MPICSFAATICRVSLAFLNEKRLLFSINHVFSSLTGPRTEADFEDFATNFPAVETRNGQMLEVANRCAADFRGAQRPQFPWAAAMPTRWRRWV